MEVMKYIKYTWTYDKKGNKVKVSTPTTADGKVIKKEKTKTGSIPYGKL